jgi:hypothetical protein
MNYKLLTTAIVTALDASNPTPRGAVWKPVQVLDVQEAEALARVGFAEETTLKPTHVCVADRKPADSTPPISGIKVDAIRQSDGTYKNGNGIRVNEDGSEYVPTDDEKLRAQYTEFLAHPADQVIAAIGQISETDREAAFPALLELEKAGKCRVSVVKALTE